MARKTRSKKRSALSGAIICCSAITCILAAVGPVESQAVPPPPTKLPAPVAEHWKNVRKQFGLNSSPAHLEAIYRDGQTTARDVGVPLSRQESKEVLRRLALGPKIGRIETTGAKSPVFGGVRMDNAGGGLVEIKVVRSSTRRARAQLTKALVADLPSGTPLKVVSSPYSYRELKDAAGTVSADLVQRKLRRLGVKYVTQVGDSVEVGLTGEAPKSAERTLQSRYPWPYLRLVRSDDIIERQGRNFLSGPLWGGEWASSSAGAACTIGYSYMVYGSRYYSATAGHCGHPGDYWRQGNSYSGGYFGRGGAYNGAYGSFSHGTTQKCDCQVIGPIPDSAATSGVLIDNNVKYGYQRTPSNTSADYYVGRIVCTSGAKYGDTYGDRIVCGDIQDVNLTTYYSDNDVAFTNLVRTSVMTTLSGDSGGPVGSSRDFMGIHGGLLGSHQYFSRSTYLHSTTTAYPTY